MPQPLAGYLNGHAAEHAHRRGWSTLANGALLDAAESAGFDLLLTADRNLAYQQNLVSRKIGVVICNPAFWHVVRQHVPKILDAIARAGPGGFVTLDLPRPPLIRRPPP